MKDYVDYMIENKSAMARAKHIQKKIVLINEIYKKLGCRLSKDLSIKELKGILNQ